MNLGRRATDGYGTGSVRLGRRIVIAGMLAVLPTLLTPGGASAQLLPPGADWVTFDTPNFRVTFPPALELIARRAADRAEWSHVLLSAEFLTPPRGRIELVVTDNVDHANGLATLFPRNRVVVYAHPPAGDEQLVFHDDWLELLVLHELAHIFHLEAAGGPWIGLRRFFGREPVLFPQIVTPSWIAEGIATFIESEHTGAGRVRGTVFDMMLRTAILEDAFFEIDQVTFDPIRWPAGATRYVYGSLFIDHLARRYGSEAVGAFVRQVGRQLVPYGFDRAARATFGTSFSAEWEVWADSLRDVYATAAAAIAQHGTTDPEILSAGGRQASHPRFAPGGGSLVFPAATGRAEASLFRLEGTSPASPLTPISTLGPVAWRPGTTTLYFTQLEFDGPHHIVSDVYAVDPGARARRLTRGARIWDLDFHPEGGSAVAVASAPGTNLLVRYEPDTGRIAPLTDSSPDVYWSSPRWSPEGQRLAVARWREGRLDIVVLDPMGEILEEVTADRAVDSHPAWSPDGRYIIFSSDRTGVPNLFAFDTEERTLRQVTNVLSGAFQPDVSGDGRWIAFAYYRSDGYYVARIPYAPDSWRDAVVTPPRDAIEIRTASPAVAGPIRRYSAWPTVLPTRWSPRITWGTDFGPGVGVSTAGSDVIERHVWAAEVVGYVDGGRGEGGVAYRFRGLSHPVVDFQGTQEWRVQAAAQDVAGTPALLRRDREAVMRATWVRRRWRSIAWTELGGELRDIDFVWEDEDGGESPGERRFPADLGGSLGLGFSTARGHGLSIGPQDGITGTVRVQARRYLSEPDWLPSVRDYWRATSRNQAYRGWDRFGFAPSVFAFRLDAAIESSAAAPGFTVGGGGRDSADPLETAPLLPRGLDFPVRGFPAGTQGGNRVVSGSAELRFPILLVERGVRVLPIGANRIWGIVFADIGAAWCPDDCRVGSERLPEAPDPLVSIGAEAIVELRLGYFADLPFRFGFGVPVRAAERQAPQLYVRLGRLF
jgi:hypothetical protein